MQVDPKSFDKIHIYKFKITIDRIKKKIMMTHPKQYEQVFYIIPNLTSVPYIKPSLIILCYILLYK